MGVCACSRTYAVSWLITTKHIGDTAHKRTCETSMLLLVSRRLAAVVVLLLSLMALLPLLLLLLLRFVEETGSQCTSEFAQRALSPTTSIGVVISMTSNPTD